MNENAHTTEALDPSLADASAVVRDLGVDPEVGLSASEASRRLAADGPNELRPKSPEPVWRKILRQFQDPLVYLLLVAIVISAGAWLAEGALGVPVDALVIALIVVANATLGLVQESRAEDAVAALADMTAANSTVLRDGQKTTVPSAQLVRGDILVLAEGDAVGADARLVTATALRVQEASLTGESGAAGKDPAPLAELATPGDRRNTVFKGTAVVQGVGRAAVTAIGMDTEMGRIATLLDETEEEPTPLQRELHTVSRALGLAVIGIAILVMAVMALVNGVHTVEDAVTILLLGVSLAVAAVPEGLPAILSLVLAIGVQAMARRKAVLKELHAVETLGSASVICSDKTGTLTRNQMTLRLVVTASGALELSGTGYDPAGEARVTAGDDAGVRSEASRVLAGGALASDAQLALVDDAWEIQGDPTEASFLVAQAKLDGVAERVGQYRREGQIPFTSDRKMMSVLGRGSEGRLLFTKGAPDVLLELCAHVQVGDEVVALDDAARAAALADVEHLSEQGYRTLGVAYRTVADDELVDPGDLAEEHERDLVYCGTVAIIDPPRSEAAEAVREAHRAGIRTIMITGDHPVTARRIARDLGIIDPDGRALTGLELDRLDARGFRTAVRETSVFARVAPEHKLRIVDALQDDRHVVAMTGDGVNDAPALKTADIGIAMGITGTEVTKEAARMILADDNYATIVAAVRQGRVIFDNIRKFLRYLLSSNMGEVATVFFGVLLGRWLGLVDPGNPGETLVPLLATQILWINLVTDSGPALALGVDPETEDVMGRPPRHVDDRIIDAAMWQRIIGIGLVMGVVTLTAFDLSLPGGLVTAEGLVGADATVDLARTTAFTTLVFAQLFNVFNSRSDLQSAFVKLFVNKWLWGAVALAALLQVAVTQQPFLQAAFGTVALDPAHWAVAIALASVVLWFEEAVKAVRRSRRGPAF